MDWAEQHKDEILTDNSAIEKCPQCKTCLFWNGENNYSNEPSKAYCSIYQFPENKPIGVITGTSPCEYYEKEIKY